MVPEQQRWLSTLFVLLLPYARSFKPPRSEPPAKCDTLIGYDCPSHYFCAGTKFNQQYGRCKCNPFYGFYGKHCQQKSGTSYLLLSLCVVLFVSGSANIYLNAVAVHRRMRKGTFELNSTGRTYLCNMICNLPVLSLGAGLAACAMNIDKVRSCCKQHTNVIDSLTLSCFAASQTRLAHVFSRVHERSQCRGIFWFLHLILF